jgi:hypothetical protein
VFPCESRFGVPKHENAMLGDQASQSRQRKQSCLWMKIYQEIPAEHDVVGSINI